LFEWSLRAAISNTIQTARHQKLIDPVQIHFYRAAISRYVTDVQHFVCGDKTARGTAMIQRAKWQNEL